MSSPKGRIQTLQHAPGFRSGDLTRVCNKCKVDKKLEEFHVHRRLRLGRAYTCGECVSALVKNWSQTSRGKELQRRAKQRYIDKPEKRAKANARNLARTRRGSVKQRAFDKNLRREYGIDSEDWARLFNDQEGRCAVCRVVLKFDSSTHVDHCHQTKKVRGLLCGLCNRALGQVKDDPWRLRELANYVERHR